MWDVDFSCALFNRTGKFFIGRDIISDQRDLVRKIWYWRISFAEPPARGTSRLLGKAMAWDHTRKVRGLRSPSYRTGLPLLHIDPLTVLHRFPTSSDAVLCHDLGPLTHPELFGPGVRALYAHAYAIIARGRPQMVFVSRATQTDFSRLFGEWGDFKVIYPPIRAETRSGALAPVADVPERFLLTVGSVGRRKNQLNAIRAFGRSDLASKGIRYVLCGPKEPGHEEVAKAAAETKGVVLLAYVSEAELAWLYRKALGFVLPSRLEGFGLPVAEAIANGLVPLISRDTVLAEVAGEGALETDPEDVGELALQMTRLVSMGQEERELRKVALMRSIERFSRSAFQDNWRELFTSASPALTRERHMAPTLDPGRSFGISTRGGGVASA